MTDTNQAPAGPARTVCESIGVAVSTMMRSIFPEDTRQHFRNARIEVLKGLRSILDARIQHLSRAEQKGTTVTIE